MGKEKTGKVSETVAVPEWVMWVMGKVDEMEKAFNGVLKSCFHVISNTGRPFFIPIIPTN